MDILPTVLDACGVNPPEGLRLDGRSVLSLLEGGGQDWPNRSITIQAHRGDELKRYRHFLTRTQDWKLVNHTGFGGEAPWDEVQKFELYDMRVDPLERKNVAEENPAMLEELRGQYDGWFDDVVNTRPANFAPPAIQLGGGAPSRIVLTRQDWRAIHGDGWGGQDTQGEWLVDIQDAGPYFARVRFLPKSKPVTVRLDLGQQSLPAGTQGEVTFKDLTFPLGLNRLRVELIDAADHSTGPYQVILEYAGESAGAGD